MPSNLRSFDLREPAPRDVVPALEGLRSPRAGELITPGMVTLSPAASLADVVGSFLKFNVHQVFVIPAEGGELEGVITPVDLLRWLEGA